MEANQKRGFLKGKLIAKSLSRVTKRISHHHQQQCDGSTGSSKVGPYPPHGGFGFSDGRNLANCSSMPRVLLSTTYSNYASYKHQTSFYEQRNVADISSSMQKVSYENGTWGYGDENVDIKATSYITNVRERFKLDSTGNKYQEML